MSAKNKSLSINVSADLTEVIDKAYNDITAPFKYAGNAMKFTIAFLTCKIKPYMYKKIELSKKEMEDFSLTLAKKCETIPQENITMPRMNILGKTADSLKYSFNETLIKVMFTNLLSKEIDNRCQQDVHPSYIDIITQISNEEANILSIFGGDTVIYNTAMFVINRENKAQYTNNDLDYYLIYKFKDGYHYKKVSKLAIDNLERQNIIKTFDVFQVSTTSNDYDILFQKIKEENYNDFTNANYKLVPLEISELGLKFIEICCS